MCTLIGVIGPRCSVGYRSCLLRPAASNLGSETRCERSECARLWVRIGQHGAGTICEWLSEFVGRVSNTTHWSDKGSCSAHRPA